MSTGDHLALGAVAALAALGIASRRRRGSKAKTPKGRDRETDKLMVNMIGEDVARSMPDYAYLFEEDAPATRKSTRQSVTQAPKTTAKKTKQDKAKKKVMINKILQKMGKLTSQETKIYRSKLGALSLTQIKQLQKQCDQEAA